jgi:hypothetical protein
LQSAGMMQLRPDVTAEQLSEALANGARRQSAPSRGRAAISGQPLSRHVPLRPLWLR